MREKILELLQHRPFQPIRISLSNGTVHVVRHPEQALIGPGYMIVGVPISGAPGPVVSNTAFVSLIHFVQVEPLTAASAPPTNN